MKLSELQIEKASSYLLDISKLMFGGTVVPLFVPGSQFGIWNFVLGIILTGLSFGTGLIALKNRQI